MKTQLIKDLEYALSFKRPHGGTGVTALCNYIVERVGEGDLSVDFCGNIHVDMRDDSSNETMFTAHVDTVHREDGFNTFKYEGQYLLADGGKPLGADDGAGVAILLHMIDHRVPGYYVFFQGEEKGGKSALGGVGRLVVFLPGCLDVLVRRKQAALRFGGRHCRHCGHRRTGGRLAEQRHQEQKVDNNWLPPAG